MSEITAALAVTGYGLIVAFTTLPVISVIAVLLGTKKAVNGVWFCVCYAAGLAIVFLLARLGVSELAWPRWKAPGGLFELCAGLLLLLVAAGWWLWDRRPARERSTASDSKFLHWMASLGPVSCALVGFQFAFHPENLVLTIAAASATAGIGAVNVIVVLIWFCVVGVSTVALPTLLYASSGGGAKARLERIRDWIHAHGAMLTVILLAVAGVVLVALGLWQLLG